MIKLVNDTNEWDMDRMPSDGKLMVPFDRLLFQLNEIEKQYHILIKKQLIHLNTFHNE